MGGALVFVAIMFGGGGFALGWWLRDVTYKLEDERDALRRKGGDDGEA